MVWGRKEDEETSSNLGLKGISSAGDNNNTNPSRRSIEDRCSTRRIVKTQCKTEETEPGIFIRKCEKTEQILKDCVGRPTEVVSSTTEYTEDDVTNRMGQGSVTFGSSSAGEPFNFPGLRSDIEALEKGIFGGINGFLEAAEEMKNGFFQVFGTPFDIIKEEDDSSSSSSIFKHRIPIEGQFGNGTSQEQKKDDSVYSDFAGQVRDV
ncbi:hypothetical protein MKW98_028991 [Papaver atlanticum]|uniref:Mal d 1-associated protein n=1 Tax=Papaver atlanticum TaxID=357466 RepID=A0AAD4XZN4_9MAGN|nr:hypothetical protein MKW98_028991 [Papaver atlanticum]